MTKRVCVEEGIVKKNDKPWMSSALDKLPIKTVFKMLVILHFLGVLDSDPL